MTRLIIWLWTCLQADRDGRVAEFAEKYACSQLRVDNEWELEQDMAERQVSPEILKELSARRATSTPFYWGVKTILKVRLSASRSPLALWHAPAWLPASACRACSAVSAIVPLLLHISGGRELLLCAAVPLVAGLQGSDVPRASRSGQACGRSPPHDVSLPEPPLLCNFIVLSTHATCSPFTSMRQSTHEGISPSTFLLKPVHWPWQDQSSVLSYLTWCFYCRLYWHIGKHNYGPNAVNIGAALFMWTILPGFTAAAYTPALVQERAIYYRCKDCPVS
jgi:hypothetical protein